MVQLTDTVHVRDEAYLLSQMYMWRSELRRVRLSEICSRITTHIGHRTKKCRVSLGELLPFAFWSLVVEL